MEELRSVLKKNDSLVGELDGMVGRGGFFELSSVISVVEAVQDADCSACHERNSFAGERWVCDEGGHQDGHHYDNECSVV